MTKPSLRDVAERAGVSTGTASQALSGRRAVSDQARARVLTAADDLGYVVNGLARALRRQASLMLGMVVPEVSNPFFADLIAAIEISCRERGLAIMFGASANDWERELDYVREFRERQVDGMLLIGAQQTRRIEAMLPKGYPVVAVDRIPEDWSRDSVGVDNRQGCDLAVEHLVSLGHRRLAFVGGKPDVRTASSRKEQFLAAAREHGAKVLAASDGEFTMVSGLRQTESLLAPGKPRPTAIVAANDLLAVGVVTAAQRVGLDVPGDLSVVGFDDSSVAGLVEPGLTTVRQQVDELAARSVSAVQARLDSPGRPPAEVRIAPQLVLRATTAPLT